MDWLVFLMLSLATWRLATMLVHEAGPAHIFLKLRSRMGIVPDENGEPLMVPDRFAPQLLSCVWCMSVWTGLGWVAFWLVLPRISIYFVAVFATSAVAILMDYHLGRR